MKKFKSLVLVFALLFTSIFVSNPTLVKCAPAPKVTSISLTSMVAKSDGYGYVTLHINGQQKASTVYLEASKMTLYDEVLYSTYGVVTSRDQIFKSSTKITSSGSYYTEAIVISVNNGGTFETSKTFRVEI